MRKFESSQKDESRAQSADSSKAYRKRRAFCCSHHKSNKINWSNEQLHYDFPNYRNGSKTFISLQDHTNKHDNTTQI